MAAVTLFPYAFFHRDVFFIKGTRAYNLLNQVRLKTPNSLYAILPLSAIRARRS